MFESRCAASRARMTLNEDRTSRLHPPRAFCSTSPQVWPSRLGSGAFEIEAKNVPRINRGVASRQYPGTSTVNNHRQKKKSRMFCKCIIPQTGFKIPRAKASKAERITDSAPTRQKSTHKSIG